MTIQPLSIRLKKVAELVPEGAVLADIGCDHAYLAMNLIQSGKILRAICSDINDGPLESAKEHIFAAHLEEKISLRLANGLEGFQPGQADTVVICGMGGMLISDILKAADQEFLAGLSVLIVQPQTEPDLVRRTLHELGFKIEQEAFAMERGKNYIIIKAVRGKERYEDAFSYKYGRLLTDSKDPEYSRWLKERAEKIHSWALEVQDPQKKEQLLEEARWIEHVI